MCFTIVLFVYHVRISLQNLTTNEHLKGFLINYNFSPYYIGRGLRNTLCPKLKRSLITNKLVKLSTTKGGRLQLNNRI
jgi:hypothetical protein